MSAIDFDTGQPSACIGTLHVLDAEHRIICVTWAEGRRHGVIDQVNLSPLIDSLRFFAPLRDDPELFATARAVDDGFAVAWGDGAIDMSAASIERLAEEAARNDGFTARLHRQLRGWQTRFGALVGWAGPHSHKRA